MGDALAIIDTPLERERLARVGLALHDDGHRIGCESTAYAIIDLAERDGCSALLFSALYHALEVNAGAHASPAGLVLATQ